MSPPTSSALLHRSLDKTYPTAVGTEGIYLLTADGRKILDGSSGAAVSCLGHGNREVIDAICEQAQKLAFAHTSFFTSDPAEELGRLIIEKSNYHFNKVLFLTSGSEAVESALKLALQYHVYNNQPQRVNIIGRKHSYHGNTLGALAAGYNPARRATFEPVLGITFHHVNRCFYQADGKGISERAYEDGLILEFEQRFLELGPETVAAVIVEPVVGATIGSVPATSTYLPRLVELCNRYGVLTIFDEVMCGMGRVGSYHAWQSLGNVAPDLQTIGKGLGAGYQPLSAVLLGKRVSDVFEIHSRGPRAFLSGHTFQGHSMACAGALAVQRILFRDDLVSRCQRLGEILHDTLATNLPPEWRTHGGTLRGLGLFRTVDFGNMYQQYGGPVAGEVSRRALALGAAVYLCSPAVDAVLLCPPFVATDLEMEKLANILVAALTDVMKSREEPRRGKI
ncbi:Hypothetical protein NCS54_01231600 [Fusarium falciforme]|uniref:Hypothetical protein n=1 Tax=Fusarium falciforme TaxID=195108 RepID=UPI00230119F2|nr:Hypothetical protein NCS54_01231600 [Fusarium falciforme]WAO94720.1 Hypothetical protein NCS54_01231600 [Fusarium falciforme]